MKSLPQKLSFSHRLIMRFITWINKDVNAGDYLNEDTVRTWAASLLTTQAGS